MRKGSQLTVLSVVFILSMVLVSMNCFGAEIKGDLLFSTDFSEDAIGSLPSAFKVDAKDGHVKVISDKTASNGKALQVLADPEEVITLIVDGFGTDKSIVVVEITLRYPRGHAVNFHLWGTPELPDSWVSWFVDARTNPYLGYRMSDPSGSSRALFINLLDNGWNTVTVIADASKDEALIGLVNDSEEMSDGPLPFRVPVSSWKSMGLRIECTWRTPLNEIYFDSVKIWAIH